MKVTQSFNVKYKLDKEKDSKSNERNKIPVVCITSSYFVLTQGISQNELLYDPSFPSLVISSYHSKHSD